MGQAIMKLTRKQDEKRDDKQNENLRRAITEFLDNHYPNFEEVSQKWDQNQNIFFQAVYETIEGVSENGGAMQFRLPGIDDLRSAFKEVHRDENVPLSKNEFQQIVVKVIKLDSLYMGQGAKDALLYIFGVPLAALLAKRIIPGPTSAVSDELFIPLVTSGTVYYLAMSNKL